MKRAVIFLHGNKPSDLDVKKFVKKSDFIICADGGAKYALDSGLTPSIVLGDFDSLSSVLQKKLTSIGVKIQKFPVEKDYTDSELAIKHALKQGIRDFLLFGAFGTRIDHFLANLTHLSKLSLKGISIQIIDNAQFIYVVSYKLEIKGKKGDFLSLIPLGSSVLGVSTSGLKWEITNDSLKFGSTRGVSNEFLKPIIQVTVNKGTLIVIHQRFNH